ncbi:hypothetical protein Nepgr_033124 [Nepenthes gracilis]|uniref:Uncharacterized protein n=1 Tax=Nepenthes gracilis TaxID=150966 RepID=A0AAD3TLJ0_NEPGR|nr:hypothetical protein Nepgr_033124 [Nepenthes gracilis]
MKLDPEKVLINNRDGLGNVIGSNLTLPKSNAIYGFSQGNMKKRLRVVAGSSGVLLVFGFSTYRSSLERIISNKDAERKTN